MLGKQGGKLINRNSGSRFTPSSTFANTQNHNGFRRSGALAKKLLASAPGPCLIRAGVNCKIDYS